MRSLKEGLTFYTSAVKSGCTPTTFAYNQLIHLYSKHGLPHDAQKLFDEMPDRNVFTWNAIISAHIRNQDLPRAELLFRSAPCKDLVTYNSMLSGYASGDGYESHALNLFVEMQHRTRFDEFTLTTMINLTAKLSEASYGRQLHSFMLKTGNDSSGFALSSLIDMYSKCERFLDVCRVFDGKGGNKMVDAVSKNAMVAACCREGEMGMAENLFWKNPEMNDSVSWNTMISGYVQNGCEEESLKFFRSMVEHGVEWNEHSFASILSACSGLKNAKIGKEVHAQILMRGFTLNPFISSGIVDVYCKCGNLKYAESVHAAIKTPNSFSVTSLIAAHSSQGNMLEACRLFNTLVEKNSVVWTALFCGYVKLQECDAVFELLNEYIHRNDKPMFLDALIIISILSATAIQATIDPGMQIHAYVLRMGYKMDEKLMNAIIDMYSKCGNLAYAENVFHQVTHKDSVLYNVMIAGYANHGHEQDAFQLFEEMLERGIRPDAVTFLVLLSACRHSGLVDDGEKYFFSMSEDYNVSPEIDHYACMIDLYGRANQLEKAISFLRRIPLELDAVIWGAFLNASMVNQNTEFAREVEEMLLGIEGNNGARYVQLANVYAAEGKWDEMGRIRRKMRVKEVKKFAGCSWVYVENRAHVFTSGDRSHSQAEAIYSMLVYLTEEFINTDVIMF